MRLLRLMVVLSVLLGSVLTLTPTALAQTPPTLSAGCQAANGATGNAAPTLDLVAAEFLTGEVITLTVVGAGNSFELRVDGAAVAPATGMGTIIEFTLTADGSFALTAQVNGPFDATTIATFTCGAEPTSGGGRPSGPTTICHRPPGNPGNAHTITVGEPAVDAHLAHGDSLGACSKEEESRHDNPDDANTVFINRITATIEIYGNCVQDVCELVLKIDITILRTAEGEGEVVVTNDNDADDANDEDDGIPEPDDGMYVIIFYLGVSHKNVTINVFQLNIYAADDTLKDDSILILVDANGNISWETQNPTTAEPSCRGSVYDLPRDPLKGSILMTNVK